MSMQLITYASPKLLFDAVKLFPVAAANNEPPEQLPDSETRPPCTIEDIRLRVETVTPLLKEILDYLPPEHWGINE